MRALVTLAAIAVALPAAAQYGAAGAPGVLYGVRSQQLPPGTVVVARTAAGAIPTNGTQQAQQLRRNDGAYSPAPTVIYRDRKESGLTVISGPNGTTVCRDTHGGLTVCY